MRALLVLSVLSVLNSGCNLFSWMDTPSGDSANLSRARGCFDSGDLTCALTYYGRISDSNISVRDSETAFVILEREGFTAASFYSSIGASTAGAVITALSNQLNATGTLNQAKRDTLYTAYAKTATITNAPLRGLVRFTAALAILGELLGEYAGSDKLLQQNEVATDAATCLAGVCAVEAACDGPQPIGTDGIDLDTGSAVLSGTSDLSMMKAALIEVSYGLGANEINSTGAIGAAVQTFSTTLGALPLTNAAEERCFRQTLLSFGVGG